MLRFIDEKIEILKWKCLVRATNPAWRYQAEALPSPLTPGLAP